MDWDVLAILEGAARSFQAMVTLFMGVIALISIFGLGMAFLKPPWADKRKRIEGRTELSADYLDALFKGARNPFYTVFSVLFGSCLVSAVLSFLIAIVGAVVAVITQSKAAGGIFLVCMLLAVFAILISFVLLGVWHILMARTYLMDDRIGRLADQEGHIFEEGLKPIGNDEVLAARFRGLLLLIGFSFICWAMMPNFAEILLGSAALVVGG